MNMLEPGNVAAMVLYLSSTVLWVSILAGLHGVLRERFPRTVQESL